MSGPSNLAPIIRKCMEIARKNKDEGLNIYEVLLILTDGKNHDIKETVEALFEAVDLPMSIIIVGIGEGDFSKMEYLDGDEDSKNGLLKDKNGFKIKRDLV